MATTTIHRGITVLSGSPRPGGELVNDGLIELSNRIGSVKYDASGAQVPTLNWDSADTAGVGTQFMVGSRVINTTTQQEWVCISDGVGAAGWVETTTGSSGVITVEAVTATPNNLAAAETTNIITNEGALAEVTNNLPAATAGLSFTFVCQDVVGIKIVAAAGDTIRYGPDVSIAGGFISSAVPGSVITLVAINTTEWVAINNQSTGFWTLEKSVADMVQDRFVSFRTASVNLKSVAQTSIYTVPTGCAFFPNTFEVVTLTALAVTVAPTVRFGTVAAAARFYGPALSTTSGRDLINSPQTVVAAAQVLSAGVTTGSTATTHTGYFRISGILTPA